MHDAARMVIRLGGVFLILSLLVRPEIVGEANLVADDLSVLVSVLCIAAGVIYKKFLKE